MPAERHVGVRAKALHMRPRVIVGVDRVGGAVVAVGSGSSDGRGRAVAVNQRRPLEWSWQLQRQRSNERRSPSSGRIQIF